jgi:5-formyltetrahydrofolate cyclo-ligase
MNQDRDTLRRQLRQRRRDLPAATRIAAAEALAQRILALPFVPDSGYVAGYWAMDGEIGLHVLQLRLPPGRVWCLPVLHGDTLRFAPWRAGDPLVTNRFGIPEPDVEPSSALLPEALALAVMPLVGFDGEGQWLGMGGGWYDRSFAFRRDSAAPPWLVGAGFGVQQVDALQAADWDILPDAICTESHTLLRSRAPETDPA